LNKTSCGFQIFPWIMFFFVFNLECKVPEGFSDNKESSKEVEVITGHFEDKFIPGTAPGKTFDARQAEFFIYKVKWGMVEVIGNPNESNMHWIGGFIYSNKPWDASWDDHKDIDGPTRNSAAFNNKSVGMTVSCLHCFNVHDGVRTNHAFNWVVEHIWGEYIRDDCIENDYLHSGRVYDCLFDGCYTGISTRSGSDNTQSNGKNEQIVLDKVLIRLLPMPYPYKWEREETVIDANGDPYNGSGIPFGHSSFFKMTDPDRNPHYIIKNCVFMATHLTKGSNLDFPPESLINVCQNNIIIWLGPDQFPGKLPVLKFPNGFKILTGERGRKLWRMLVRDWHTRHPGVGANRKPDIPGGLEFPKMF